MGNDHHHTRGAGRGRPARPAAGKPNSSVEAHVYATPQRQFSFCSDMVLHESDSIGPERWRAVAGTIGVELSPPGIRARAPHLRRATVTLTDLVLQNSAGTRVSVPRPVD